MYFYGLTVVLMKNLRHNSVEFEGFPRIGIDEI